MSDSLDNLIYDIINNYEFDYEKDVEKYEEWTDKLLKKIDPNIILEKIIYSLERVGEMYEKFEIFLAEMMISGEKAKIIFDRLKPFFESNEISSKGIVIFGSVFGDVHDIGKTIISAFLRGSGFFIYDLGVEVLISNFIEQAEKNNANIIALSTLLSSCKKQMKMLIDELKDKGIREKYKVVIGGRPIDIEYAKSIGADGFAFNPKSAIKVFEEVMKGKKLFLL